MAQKSFVNVYESSKNVLSHVYIEDGIRKEELVHFKPFCAVETEEDTGWTDLFGKKLKPRSFDSISDYNKWKREAEGTFPIYGDIQSRYQFIASRYRGEIPYQKEGMNIYSLDIEVYCHHGFPAPETALHPVNAITMYNMITGEATVFGYAEFKPHKSNVNYIFCHDEFDLLKKFIDFMKEANVDALTGWDISGFDIVYLVNRIRKEISPTAANRLSPCHKISEKTVLDKFKNEKIEYGLVGIVNYDYKKLYEKFTYETREQYTLNYICGFELGENKVDYQEEYGDLATLYDENPQLFFEYNIRDCELIFELDKKMRYIDLGFMITYLAKCLPEDVYGVVAVWDAFLYNELLDQKKFCPPTKMSSKAQFPGGWNQEPETGLHKWVMVYDIASSYPNQIRSFNMSPETVIEDYMIPDELKDIRNQLKGYEDLPSGFNNNDVAQIIKNYIDMDKLEEMNLGDILSGYSVSMAPNGHFFRTDIEGFVPKIVARVFNARKEVKKKIKALQREKAELKKMLESI